MRALLSALCLGLGIIGAGPAAAQSGIERPFALVDGSGRSVTDRDFRGRWLLMFFGYTSCPDICPTTLSEIATVMDQLGPLAARVQPIFVSVDPQRDTPALLREYVDAFGAGIEGLTGTEEQVARAASTFGVLFYKIPGNSPYDYTVAHSALIYAIGPERGLVTRFSADANADRIAAILRLLVQ
jgi:protein SCO1/2